MTNVDNSTVISRCMTGVSQLLCMIVLTAFSVSASASAPETKESLLLGERPSKNGETTVVDISVQVFDIEEIDDVRQRFRVDMFIAAHWYDPRLALPEEERAGRTRFMMIDDVWTPRVLIINNRGVTPQLREGVEVDDLGNVSFLNRLSGELSANLEFQKFPFDVQRLPIEIVSYQYTTEELVFSPNLSITSPTESFSIEGWHLKQLDPEVIPFMPPHSDALLPRVTYTFEASRDSDYYILTMLIPMALIIFMAWTVFWLQPNLVPPRIAISTASIFSLIALGVSLRLGLPKVSYLTRADIFVLGCTLMVFIALGVAVLGSRWAGSDRMEQALKANAIARWVYMLLFVVVAVIAFYP